ncbi:hypothetical protein [Rhodopirellula sallentina]|uniref:hypothetical protein n=1 Tax=Rhodopirellula sallentina TaxID=1263869 RepID=UPI00191BF36C|nr:hypothetical protein [Rhodopirellula sallentina]
MSDRRSFLATSVLASAATFLAARTATPLHGAANTSKDDDVIGHGDFRYRVHKDWAQINPFQVHLDNCHEMVQDSEGAVGNDWR